MRESALMICLPLLVAVLAVSCSDSGQEGPQQGGATRALAAAELGDYSRGIAVGEMSFLWRLGQDSIDIKLVAKTPGWVGIGFNPEADDNMKGANFIIGYVTAGKVEIFDHYGNESEKHKDDEKLGGATNVSNLAGSEADGQTEIAFTIPLNSGDSMDKPLSVNGDTVVFLAYGKSDRIILKHKFRSSLKVNLSTGTHSVIRMR